MRFKQLIGQPTESVVEEQSLPTNQKKTKFNQLINSYKLTEQTADEINAAAMQDAALDPTLAQTQQAQQQPVPAPEETETETLTPEGEVELIRLLRKALTLDVDPNKLPLDVLNTDINQNNARDIYEKIKKFMSTYSE